MNRPRDDMVTGVAQPVHDGGRSPALLTTLERGPSLARRMRVGEPGTAARAAFGTESGTEKYAGKRVPRWIEVLLRAPLRLKLVGANLLLIVAAAVTAVDVRQRELSAGPVLAVVAVAFIVALLINTGLVMLAVQPIKALEKTVNTIWRGDLAARVPVSLLADDHFARVARMFNILLDGLVSDRDRTRRLATELITAADRERAAIARELHDSAAQSLAALVMQLSVASRTAGDTSADDLHARIETAQALATSTLEEVRLLAHTMHPRVLDDLGLIAALRRLARETNEHAASSVDSDRDDICVDVDAVDGSDERLPAVARSVLYRVAQEAVSNARRHASPTSIEIRLRITRDAASLEVLDDGKGFELASASGLRAGIGLFTMQERVSLVDGEFLIDSSPGAGTRVRASIPLHIIPATSPE